MNQGDVRESNPYNEIHNLVSLPLDEQRQIPIETAVFIRSCFEQLRQLHHQVSLLLKQMSFDSAPTCLTKVSMDAPGKNRTFVYRLSGDRTTIVLRALTSLLQPLLKDRSEIVRSL